jgi:hypothetical protein
MMIWKGRPDGAALFLFEGGRRGREAVRGRTAIEKLKESACGAEPGWSLRLQMPSMPSRRGSFLAEPKKERKKVGFCVLRRLAITSKSLIKTGRLHYRKSIVPASSDLPSSTD